MKKIAFAGTDGRTLLGALIVMTAISEFFKEKFEGFVIRGTPAMPKFAKIMKWPVKFIKTLSNSVTDYADATIDALRKGLADIVIPMPEDLQFGGFVDMLIKAGFGDNVIGLTKAGAILEAHKIKCKKICRDAGIPVAEKWQRVDVKDYDKVLQICLKYIRKYKGVVLKYPFSAGGKGARVIEYVWQIREVYDQLIKDYKDKYTEMFGKRRSKAVWPLLVESLMRGIEISFTIFVDKFGNFQILPTAMDYPERFEGPPSKDNPITGGMYSVSPHPFETPELLEMAAEVIARPLIKKMKEMGILRPCILYPGCFLNVDEKGLPVDLRVSEINIRWGEPEAQPVMRRLRNMGAMIVAMINGDLDQVPPEVRDRQLAFCAAYVTGAGGPDGQKGYPWSVTKGEPLDIDPLKLQKKGIQIIPSAMDLVNDEDGDWKQGYVFKSDGTRVAFGNINVERKNHETWGMAAERGRNALINALKNGKIRVIPRESREDPNSNRLDMRKEGGKCFKDKEKIFLRAA